MCINRGRFVSLSATSSRRVRSRSSARWWITSSTSCCRRWRLSRTKSPSPSETPTSSSTRSKTRSKATTGRQFWDQSSFGVYTSVLCGEYSRLVARSTLGKVERQRMQIHNRWTVVLTLTITLTTTVRFSHVTSWLFDELTQWLGGVVVRALDLRLEIAGSIPAAALSSATLDKLFTYIVQRLWS